LDRSAYLLLGILPNTGDASFCSGWGAVRYTVIFVVLVCSVRVRLYALQ